MLDSILPIAAISSFVLSLTALIILVIRTRSFGGSPTFAGPQGKVARGVAYAFGPGMMPWEKESAARHLPTYIAGVLYHAGIFGSLLLLFIILAELSIPAPVMIVLQLLLIFGLLCGATLFVKRILKSYMRAISTPDDYIANVLVNLFLAAALAVTFIGGFEPVFFVITIVLFLYMPLGKIRHCFFFFYTRILFGLYFGRRGVLPRPSRSL